MLKEVLELTKQRLDFETGLFFSKFDENYQEFKKYLLLPFQRNWLEVASVSNFKEVPQNIKVKNVVTNWQVLAAADILANPVLIYKFSQLLQNKYRINFDKMARLLKNKSAVAVEWFELNNGFANVRISMTRQEPADVRAERLELLAGQKQARGEQSADILVFDLSKKYKKTKLITKSKEFDRLEEELAAKRQLNKKYQIKLRQNRLINDKLKVGALENGRERDEADEQIAG